MGNVCNDTLLDFTSRTGVRRFQPKSETFVENDNSLRTGQPPLRNHFKTSGSPETGTKKNIGILCFSFRNWK